MSIILFTQKPFLEKENGFCVNKQQSNLEIRNYSIEPKRFKLSPRLNFAEALISLFLEHINLGIKVLQKVIHL
jgi:hypothetical protein